jgi:hypothetical protein
MIKSNVAIKAHKSNVEWNHTISPRKKIQTVYSDNIVTGTHFLGDSAY